MKSNIVKVEEYGMFRVRLWGNGTIDVRGGVHHKGTVTAILKDGVPMMKFADGVEPLANYHTGHAKAVEVFLQKEKEINNGLKG